LAGWTTAQVPRSLASRRSGSLRPFTDRDLRPDEYPLIAADDVEDGAYLHPDFCKAVGRGWRVVEVAGKQTLEVLLQAQGRRGNKLR
jgi:hypothetical protein